MLCIEMLKVYINEHHAVLLLQVHPKASFYIIIRQSVEIKS